VKTVLVTGGSSGIGRASALAAAKAGWNVFVGYSTGEARASDVVRAIRDQGGSAWSVRIDLGDPDSGTECLEHITAAGADGCPLCSVVGAGIITAFASSFSI